MDEEIRKKRNDEKLIEEQKNIGEDLDPLNRSY